MRPGPALSKSALAALLIVPVLSGCGPAGSTATTDVPSVGSSPSSAPVVSPRTSPGPWDRPADQATAVTNAGLVLDASEHLDVHYHAHLDVLVDGAAMAVPANLGINVADATGVVKHGTPGIAALHTHTADGILHVEAAQADVFTLGQLFAEWDVRLDATHLGGYGPDDSSRHVLTVLVNGKKVSGNPASVVLSNHEEIALVVTRPGEAVQGPGTFSFPS